MIDFPKTRLRRLRRTEAIRSLVRETKVDIGDLIYPVFVVEGKRLKQQVASMPGIHRYSPDILAREAEDIYKLGIPAVILFGIPKKKDAEASSAYSSGGIIQQAIHTIKRAVPDLIVITDVCLCEYMNHGHCGVLVDGTIDNDRSLELLAKTALSHAQSGADIVAPSDMMDGRVKIIRQILDENDFNNIPILSYAAKYASAFYGPFREAAESAPQFGDRRSYQMDPPNWREALREVKQDIVEGADIVMIKPALPYLDIIRKVRDTFNHTLAAFSVSGEYAMIKAAADQGWLDEKRIVLEMLTAIKRAGADIIITYYAKEVTNWLSNTNL